MHPNQIYNESTADHDWDTRPHHDFFQVFTSRVALKLDEEWRVHEAQH